VKTDGKDMAGATFKSGFVAVVGRPNVGKSTLVNRLVGGKVSIVSDKPQTTRNRIMCVLTQESAQMVFLDTPGIHKPRGKLGAFMLKAAESALAEVNVIIFVVDASRKKGGGDEYIMAKLAQADAPVILAANKIDLLPDSRAILPAIKSYADDLPLSAAVPVCALKQTDFAPLLTEIGKHLTCGPKYFPDGMVTDQPEQMLAAEMIREKILRATAGEVPHSIAVKTDEMKLRENQDMYIRATIYVERASQKGIIIGAGGRLIKEIGQAARADIQALLGNRVYLDLWVKVKEGWRDRDGALREFGFGRTC
jgi:GTP-binding protein Era